MIWGYRSFRKAPRCYVCFKLCFVMTYPESKGWKKQSCIIPGIWRSFIDAWLNINGFIYNILYIYIERDRDTHIYIHTYDPWGEEVGSWMAGRSKVVHFQKCEVCHQKRGFHRVCVWNSVKKVRFFNPVDGIGVSIGVSQWVWKICSARAPRPRRKVPKPRALWEPQVLQERPSGASPNHGFTKRPIQRGIALTNDNTTLQTLW